MIRGPLLRLVILISCAHALVHMYEQSAPSIEQNVAAEFFADNPQAGKQATGWMAWCWRFPWGIGALFAGWIVDHLGSRRMLSAYLLGCGGCCLALWFTPSLSSIFITMFAMGAFASIYHPAGLALISHETNRETLPSALGIHGVFGSAGIASAPFIAAFALAQDVSWRGYYVLLAAPGILLGLYFLAQAGRDKEDLRERPTSTNADDEDERADWGSYFMLTVLAVIQGLVYSAVLSFLPRYLAGLETSFRIEGVSMSRLATSMILLVGCVGQYLAGKFANPRRLEIQLAWISLSNAPCLAAMAIADSGLWRATAAGMFALVHFMHQPIYNSLIAKYSPRRRRSLCYGFSFAMGLGVGGTGSVLAGYSYDGRAAHWALAVAALLASGVALLLDRRQPGNGE